MPWITVNGARVLIGEDGKLQGNVGRKIEKVSPRAHLTIDRAAQLLEQRGMKLGAGSTTNKGGKWETTYSVSGKGGTRTMSAKAIQKMLTK